MPEKTNTKDETKAADENAQGTSHAAPPEPDVGDSSSFEEERPWDTWGNGRTWDGAEAARFQRLDVRPTLIIGIGGTGCIAVKMIKRHLQKISYGQPVPFVRFVVFDTTAEDTTDPKLDEGEFVNIGQLDFNEIVGNLGDYDHLQSWFPNRFKPMQLGLGAMGVRHIGRLCYFQWRESPKIRDLLKGRIEQLMNSSLPDTVRELGAIRDLRIDQTIGVDIHIIGSGSGGTGSGIYLDLAYDVRRWAKELAKSARVIGHLLLPSAFEGLVPEPVMPQAENNAHALLSEIDHFIGKGGWEVRYRSETVSTDETPFDLIFLEGRTGMDGAVRSHDEILATMGAVVASLTLTPVGKDLFDTAVNLIPPILSGFDPIHHKPCPYSSYGVSIGEVSPREVIERGSTAVRLRILDGVAEPGGDPRNRVNAWVNEYLTERQLAFESIFAGRPEVPRQELAPVKEMKAKRATHEAAVRADTRNKKQEWLALLRTRLDFALGDSLTDEILKLVRGGVRDADTDGTPPPLRFGDLLELRRAVLDALDELSRGCTDESDTLQTRARQANAAIAEVGAVKPGTPPPVDAGADFLKLGSIIDEGVVRGEYFRLVAEQATAWKQHFLKNTAPVLESLRLLVHLLREERSRLALRVSIKYADFESPAARFVSPNEVLRELYDDPSVPQRRFRLAVANLLRDGDDDTSTDIRDQALKWLERVSRDAVEESLSRYRVGNRLDLDLLSSDVDNDERSSGLLKNKVKDMYRRAQPAIRCAELYPKEKFVETGRVGAPPDGPVARVLKDIDGTVQSVRDDPSDVLLVRFVYGVPLWAVTGVERWAASAIHVQTAQGADHNFLDPTWNGRIDPLLPRPSTDRDNVYIFSTLCALGRIHKPAMFWELDGEDLHGVKTRKEAYETFRGRLLAEKLSRRELLAQINDSLKQKGPPAAQCEFFERHIEALEAELEKRLGGKTSTPSDDAHILREEITEMRARIAEYA